MNARSTTLRIWGIVSVTLTLGTLLSASLATVTLDTFVRRPVGAGSMTTLIPGFTYAAATVMKVCIVSGLVTLVLAVAHRVAAREKTALPGQTLSNPAFPIWGIIAISLAPWTPLVGALTVVMCQELSNGPASLTMSDFSYISRIAVFVTLSAFVLGAASAVIPLVRRESLALPLLGLAINMSLIALFWHFEFYALGFDQDTWAPR